MYGFDSVAVATAKARLWLAVLEPKVVYPLHWSCKVVTRYLECYGGRHNIYTALLGLHDTLLYESLSRKHPFWDQIKRVLEVMEENALRFDDWPTNSQSAIQVLSSGLDQSEEFSEKSLFLYLTAILESLRI